jgi:glycosyltransferase involved in cell wall biosynthesis
LQKIAVAVDMRGWAYDNIANNISVTLRERAHIQIIYLDELSCHEIFNKIFIEGNYDHVHFVWREPYLRFFFDDQIANDIISGIARDSNCDRAAAIARLADGMGRVTLSFGVYDHVHLDASSISNRRAGLAFADGYAVSSNKLSRLYASAYGVSPTVETPDGVNRALFRPHNLNRLRETGHPLVVGWVGNSEWHNEAGDDPKGFETIVKPAVRWLADLGIAVVPDFADRKERWRPREEMPGYYNTIDVLLCASAMEGTPNPVLEAMACGVPVISTDVGVVPEVFGPKQRKFIVRRDISSIGGAIRRLSLDRDLLTDLSQENLIQIASWDWASFSNRWRFLLEASHAERVRGRGLARSLYVRARCANLELSIKNSAIASKLIDVEATACRLQSMETSLQSIETSLHAILEVASWQRKMLRPIRWVWVKALPVRRRIAHLRRRR